MIIVLQFLYLSSFFKIQAAAKTIKTSIPLEWSFSIWQAGINSPPNQVFFLLILKTSIVSHAADLKLQTLKVQSSPYKRTIHWMPIINQLWMNLNWVS